MTDASETLTIDAFIEARLREDEQVARTAGESFASEGRRADWREQWSGSLDVGDELYNLGDSTVTRHAERFDPARVLRQCAALRDVLESLKTAADAWASLVAEHGDPRTEPDFVQWLGPLASIWSSHPDFRAEWTA